ncbi:MAG: glutamate synthase subunit alpha, partial [Limisphaerales bacterium]
MNDNKMSTQARWQGLPPKQGLYDPQFEHDACGVGFVVNMKGRKSHEVVQQGIQILINLDHRGAVGCEPNTGDGAGILIQLPHKFFTKVAKENGFTLPAPGRYGVAMIYMPKDQEDRHHCERTFERVVREEGHSVLGWRTVPTDNSTLGPTAVATEPFIRQCFIERNVRKAKDELAFERKLYVIRKRALTEIRNSGVRGTQEWYMPSVSCRTIVYKGMLMPAQVDQYYPELRDPDMDSALALVHSRFSTNTFPSWERSHPYRYIAHNGEINTLRGNINWMHARQSMFESDAFGKDIKKIFPIINPTGSDSAMFDNCLELLVLG